MDNQKYEIMVIIKPDLTQKQTEKELDNLRGFIKAQKGSIFHEDLWGMRNLAYTIKKYNSGYYAIFYFEIAGKELKQLNRNINLEGNVMRHLIVALPPNYQIKSLADFEQEAMIEEEKAEEKEETKKAPIKKEPKKTVEKAVEKKEEPKKEEKPKKEAKAPKADKKEKLEEIDEKLQSIIDDPDIMNI